jgi:toxin ParE1/3/4
MRVRWTELAARDLTAVSDYIGERDGAGAACKVALRIYEGIAALAQFPYRGRKEGTRELILAGTPYLAIYRLHQENIEITRILHGAQKWPE